MMKIAVMGGAYMNSGDFLIEQRSKDLIEAITGRNVDLLKRNIAYDDKIAFLNNYDAIVFAGGPIFQPNIYPKRIPFVRELNKLKTPIRMLGGGWKGCNASPQTLYKKYTFTKDMSLFICNAAKQYPLGCRDWYTIRTLRRLGISNLVMTGCPAWYDIHKIHELTLNAKYHDCMAKDKITIGVSDPALSCNKPYFYGLVQFLMRKYPNADIKLLFHRGIGKKDLKKTAMLCKNDPRLTCVDISGSAESFKEYDSCFLHIGFRVHAHIYNLSQGNVSVLINEDARGMGVNHALGIENINCLLKTSRMNTPPPVDMRIFEQIICDYLDCIIKSNYVQYRFAYEHIRENYKVMKNFIETMI